MAVEKRNIKIDQGAVYKLVFTWYDDNNGVPGSPIPMTGATGRMQIRKTQGSPVLLEAISGDGITIDEPNGTVTVLLPPSKTNLLTAKSCKYDLEVVYSADEVYRLLEGSVSVNPNITQDTGEPVLS